MVENPVFSYLGFKVRVDYLTREGYAYVASNPFIQIEDPHGEYAWSLRITHKVEREDEEYTWLEDNPSPFQFKVVQARAELWLATSIPREQDGILALRYIRLLARWFGTSSQTMFLHGSMVELDGTGICFVGGQKSGKSSLALISCFALGGLYVSNDDIIVDLADERVPFGIGSPRTIRVRGPTIEFLSRDRVMGRLGRIQSIRREKDEDGAVYVTPSDLRELGIGIKRQSRIDLVVETSFGDHEHLVEVRDPVGKARLLLDHTLASPDPMSSYLRHHHAIEPLRQLPPETADRIRFFQMRNSSMDSILRNLQQLKSMLGIRC